MILLDLDHRLQLGHPTISPLAFSLELTTKIGQLGGQGLEGARDGVMEGTPGALPDTVITPMTTTNMAKGTVALAVATHGITTICATNHLRPLLGLGF